MMWERVTRTVPCRNRPTLSEIGKYGLACKDYVEQRHQATRRRRSQLTTLFGMRGRPGLRAYASPFAGMQSGSSRSANAASSEMSVPSHSPSISRATSRARTSPVCSPPVTSTGEGVDVGAGRTKIGVGTGEASVVPVTGTCVWLSGADSMAGVRL